MPRTPLLMTHNFPYHVTARSNNREWFYLPQQQCWEIFTDLLTAASLRYHFQIHAFVLMKNHYHLIGTTSPEHNLSKVMEWFQRSANRKINNKAGRINHLFGGPYKGSLIDSDLYYYHAVRYIYQNPVDAGIVRSCFDFRYSSLVDNRLPLVSPQTGIEAMIPRDPIEFRNYIDSFYDQEIRHAVTKALRKKVFRFPKRMEPSMVHKLELRA